RKPRISPPFEVIFAPQDENNLKKKKSTMLPQARIACAQVKESHCFMTTETAGLSVTRPGRARLAVATIFCLNGLALANWIARIPDVKQQLALSDQRLGLVLLCVAAGALVAQPIVGWLIGRIGSRRMTTGMLIGFC